MIAHADPPEVFRCDVFPERDRVRVALVGELDLATALQLDQVVRELLEVGFEHVVVDLTDLAFLASSGLLVILRLQAFSQESAFRFELKPGPRAVQRIFDLSGTIDLFTFTGPLNTRLASGP
jgi:anti-sigma B factor antagonist